MESGGIVSLESIPGLLKSLKIRALIRVRIRTNSKVPVKGSAGPAGTTILYLDSGVRIQKLCTAETWSGSTSRYRYALEQGELQVCTYTWKQRVLN
jgi:hypothetical protein